MFSRFYISPNHYNQCVDFVIDKYQSLTKAKYTNGKGLCQISYEQDSQNK